MKMMILPLLKSRFHLNHHHNTKILFRQVITKQQQQQQLNLLQGFIRIQSLTTKGTTTTTETIESSSKNDYLNVQDSITTRIPIQQNNNTVTMAETTPTAIPTETGSSKDKAIMPSSASASIAPIDTTKNTAMMKNLKSIVHKTQEFITSKINDSNNKKMYTILKEKINHHSSKNNLKGETSAIDSSKLLENLKKNGQIFKQTQMENITKLTELLNQLTGYTSVQECKDRVHEKNNTLNEARRNLEELKRNYQETVDSRRKCQSQINHLLQRKDSWTDHDINRFTQLYREDISLEQNEMQSQSQYNSAQEKFDEAHVDYLNEIRERYVQEQLYSDKIRRASTWWTWGLISVHLIIFITLNLFVEPNRRAKFQKDLQNWVMSTNAQERELFKLNLESLLDNRLDKLPPFHNDQMESDVNENTIVTSEHSFSVSSTGITPLMSNEMSSLSSQQKQQQNQNHWDAFNRKFWNIEKWKVHQNAPFFSGVFIGASLVILGTLISSTTK